MMSEHSQDLLPDGSMDGAGLSVMPEHSQDLLPDGSMDGAGLPLDARTFIGSPYQKAVWMELDFPVMPEHLQDLLPDGSMNVAGLPVMPEHLQDLLLDGIMDGARLPHDARTFTELPTRWQYGWSQTSP